MKKIEAIVGTETTHTVWRSLLEAGVSDITATTVKGFTGESPLKSFYRGRVYEIDFRPMTKLEVIVPDSLVVPVLSAFTREAGSNQMSGGKVFVSSVEKIVRIEADDIEEDVQNWLR